MKNLILRDQLIGAVSLLSWFLINKQDSFIHNFQYMKYNTDSSSIVYEYHRLCLRKEALEYKCTVLERF